MITKNKLFIVLAALFYCSTAFSQDESKPKTSNTAVEFGLQHSINFTHLIGDSGPVQFTNRTEELIPLKNRTTFDLGMFAIMHVSKTFSIQPEVVYTFMGAHFQKETIFYHDVGTFSGTENISYALDYIKGTLAVNLKFNEKVFLQVGGYAASLLSAEEFYPWWGPDLDKQRTSLTNVNNFDGGILGGFGFSTKIVNLTFRYNYGLTDVFKKNEDIDLSNGVLQFVVQWKFFSDYR